MMKIHEIQNESILRRQIEWLDDNSQDLVVDDWNREFEPISKINREKFD